jgi:hypothetical protein
VNLRIKNIKKENKELLNSVRKGKRIYMKSLKDSKDLKLV